MAKRDRDTIDRVDGEKILAGIFADYFDGNDRGTEPEPEYRIFYSDSIRTNYWNCN